METSIKEILDDHKRELESLLFGLKYKLKSRQATIQELPSHMQPAMSMTSYENHLENIRAKLANNPVLPHPAMPSYVELASKISVSDLLQRVQNIPLQKIPREPESARESVSKPAPQFVDVTRLLNSVVNAQKSFGPSSRDLRNATDGLPNNTSESPSTAPPPPQSLFKSVTEYISYLIKRTSESLPASWYASQSTLLLPEDPRIKQIIPSVFGGDLNRLKFKIKLISASDVPPMDWLTSSSDVYAEVSLIRGVQGLNTGKLDALPTLVEKKASSIQYINLNPIWNEFIDLNEVEIIPVLADALLHLSLWDYDTLASNDPIGYCTAPLIDALEISGICPFPLCPIQNLSPVSLYCGIFCSIDLKKESDVGLLTVKFLALQGFDKLESTGIRLSVKITDKDPLLSDSYDGRAISSDEITDLAVINNTGHCFLKDLNPITHLFKPRKEQGELFLHVTVIGESTRYGQLSIPIKLIEEIKGFKGKKLKLLKGNEDKESLKKCKVFYAINCELV
jgi:C2 domain